MSQASKWIPESPESVEWDAVIVGTGMGGSTLGAALARKGHRVLFIEKGHFLFGDHDRGDGSQAILEDNSPEPRLRAGWWPKKISGNSSGDELSLFAPLGCGTGGSTSLYAAQLERLSPADFECGSSHADIKEASIPKRWPISYDDLVPYYREAERLYEVCGTEDPLQKDPEAELREPPELSERDAYLFDSFEKMGLNPFRAHVGCRFVEGCDECGGSLCPRSCKSDAGRISLMPAITQHDAKILSNCEVIKLEANAERVTGVVCRKGDEELVIRGKMVVVAANAYMTPALLLKSSSSEWPEGLANRSGLVGRNLMMHTSDFIAIRAGKKLSHEGPKKALALNDFYTDGGQKLGTLQSVGIQVNPGYVLYHLRNRAERERTWYLQLARPFFRPIAVIAAAFYKSASVFASIVEDLPYEHNRIKLDPDAENGMTFEYHYADELLERNRFFRKRLSQTIGKRHAVQVLNTDDNLNFGHVCGTCRFGDDPDKSVLDRDNRAHDVENLYVVDASFFPTSGGNNPSLTIAANALRVAGKIDERLRA
ncbi:MAG: GMC oxidoreductase [Myxococcota bacterium]